MQALLWMQHVAPADGWAVVMPCDSHYAMGVAEGLIDAKSNLEAAVLVQELLQQVRRQQCLTFCHVKGHSTDGGNDRADELVWWGKEAGGPFCRITLEGQGEGEGRDRPEPGYDNRRNARLAARAAQGDVSRRSSVGLTITSGPPRLASADRGAERWQQPSAAWWWRTRWRRRRLPACPRRR